MRHHARLRVNIAHAFLKSSLRVSHARADAHSEQAGIVFSKFGSNLTVVSQIPKFLPSRTEHEPNIENIK